ncbi:hypothetical protein BX600DRAFT_386977 [Xylariales sp. PMI_506]|nr:hypothetical protein BX600DRAFT_386977 [Xylariales sp. PMI_506]
MAAANPVAFRPIPVTFWTTVVYLALLIPLVIIHETVPPAPKSYPGVDLAEAWADLDTLTRAYHPYNSRANDVVRQWLLERVHQIALESGAHESSVVVFDDLIGNVTATGKELPPKALVDADVHPKNVGTYFEGNNIMVYIRGKDDPPGKWWEENDSTHNRVIGKGGVLVNAHFDSVATAYGATDDGMGVVSVLQLVKYFSAPENQPQRGIVTLLNNNEEDWLWGAQAFGNHPLMPFCHVFLNLEGAAAGGKANLFRTTDGQVTRAYKGSHDPFGTVVASDMFGLGVIRSGTDYQIFYDVYGMRGLDVAFYRPRAIYHTNQDDTRHTSRDSLWHMLSNALHTVKSLSGDTGDTFIGERPDGDQTKIPNGASSSGVWFDLFGQTFAIFDLHSLFAWSLTLLIATPLLLIALTYLLVRHDKYYFFAAKKTSYEESVLDPVVLGGRKGIIRFPFALIVAGSLVVGSAYLINKVNPFVIYTYEYTNWAMMISLFYFVFWTITAGANFARPSALHRGYAIIWLFVITWALLVAVTVFEDRFNIAAGYPFVFLQGAVFLATFIALAEQFALPTKTAFAQNVHDDHDARDHAHSIHEHLSSVPHADEHSGGNNENNDQDIDDEPTETSPLFGGSSEHGNRRTFGTVYRRSIASIVSHKTSSRDGTKNQPFGDEQLWSGKLPSWLWILQFLILGPFFIILVAQVGLVVVASIKETGGDGGSTLVPFLAVSFFSILILLPLTPFTQRITHHVPMLLLVVFIGTLVFNLVVFPFSSSSRYKLYFQQDIDLDSGKSLVHYVGGEQYVRQALADLPSAMDKKVVCVAKSAARPDHAYCTYDGSDILPLVSKKATSDWISFNSTRAAGSNTAQLTLHGEETRVCGLRFSKPLSRFQVRGGAKHDERFGRMPAEGLDNLLVYRRDWDTPWTIDVEWAAQEELSSEAIDVQAFCRWNDANSGAVPALDEALQYIPKWIAVTKLNNGLVEGTKAYKI